MNITLRKPSGLRLSVSILLLATVLMLGLIAPVHAEDILYITDSPYGLDPNPYVDPKNPPPPPRGFPFGAFPEKNAVKRFDAYTGRFLDSNLPNQAFIFTDDCSANAPLSGSVCAPDRLLIKDGTLYLGNGNGSRNHFHDTDFPNLVDISGEILRFNLNGKPRPALVPAVKPVGSSTDNPDAPYAPTGMVLHNDVLYVANLNGKSTPQEILNNNFCDPNVDVPHCPPGGIIKYNAKTGVRLGSIALPNDLPKYGQHPRGMVVGPDGKLYIAVRDLPNKDFPDLNPTCQGHILQYDFKEKTFKHFIDTNDCSDIAPDPADNNHLHRPDDIAFAPNGNLYVANFRKNSGDVDRILVFGGPRSSRPGKLINSIVLDIVGGKRIFAQGLLFGPGGRLFVPIAFALNTLVDEDRVGEVRAYDVNTKDCRVFVKPPKAGGPLKSPYFLSFGKTDPATHLYRAKVGEHEHLAFNTMPRC
jgi:hypothetical protein